MRLFTPWLIQVPIWYHWVVSWGQMYKKPTLRSQFELCPGYHWNYLFPSIFISPIQSFTKLHKFSLWIMFRVIIHFLFLPSWLSDEPHGFFTRLHIGTWSCLTWLLSAPCVMMFMFCKNRCDHIIPSFKILITFINKQNCLGQL